MWKTARRVAREENKTLSCNSNIMHNFLQDLLIKSYSQVARKGDHDLTKQKFINFFQSSKSQSESKAYQSEPFVV